MKDDELLGLVRDESQRAIGYDNDSDLISERERALKYVKGEVPDLPVMPNRSAAVSTDVSDAVETILPDLVEIFAAGDDVATFIPVGEEDEKAAQQETDYVNHVMFNENPGWLTLYTMFKDALQVKTGVVKFWAEDCPPEEEEIIGASAIAVDMAQKNGEIVALVENGQDEETGEPLYDFTVAKPASRRVRIAAVPPEDFAVARDTVALADTTYCSMRSRPRAQDLIAQGYDAALVDKLPAHGGDGDDSVRSARDTVSEGDFAAGGDGELRAVEIVEHIIRIASPKGPKFWSVVTGENESVLLRKEEIKRIPFAAVTPYLVPHRFIGESVADKLMPIQRINSTLTRMMLDSGLFALNQRSEVVMDGITEDTLPDLLNNVPGGVVRVSRQGTVTPISAGALSFDVFGAMEFMATKAEQRSGIVRAAQGLTPDTLHETAKGALALLTAANKRVRLIGRIFAETGLKDLYLGVHGLLREHGGKKGAVRLRNQWVEVDPTSWGIRSDMSIEVGLGSSGKEAEMMAMQEEAAIMEKIIALQGGPTGPVVYIEQVYALSIRMFEKLGNKAPAKYLIDPAIAAEAAKKEPPKEPAPDPAMVEAQTRAMESQSKAALAQQEAQAKAELTMAQAGADAELAMQEAAAKAELAQQEAAARHELKVQETQNDLDLKREKLQLDAGVARQRNELEIAEKARVADAELQLKRDQLAAEIAMKRELALIAPVTAGLGDLSNVEIGGDAG